MNLLIGENIRRNRIEKNLTQEELAGHLGVLPQSVSKWERGEGYPDIEILPSISNYFKISVDELLGVSKSELVQKYDDINQKWSYNNKHGFHNENIDLMRNALKIFPNDALLLVQLSTSLEKLDGTDIEKEKYLRESIAVQEQIIRYCDDCEVRGATLYNICFAYWKIGEYDKAVKQAKKLPNLYKTRENALVYFLQGEEKHKNSKEALTPLAWVIAVHLSALSETENNPQYLEDARQIIDILFGENKDTFIQKIVDGLDDKTV